MSYVLNTSPDTGLGETSEELRRRLEIPAERLSDLNSILLSPDMQVINDFLAVVARYGTPEEINQKATEARRLEKLMAKLAQTQPAYLEDLNWLLEQRTQGKGDR